MIRTQVYLTEDLYTRIQLEAKRGQKKAAEVVRELLQKGLIRQKKQTLGNALLELSKIGAKGPRDLSTNHDRYLYGE